MILSPERQLQFVLQDPRVNRNTKGTWLAHSSRQGDGCGKKSRSSCGTRVDAKQLTVLAATLRPLLILFSEPGVIARLFLWFVVLGDRN